MFTLLTGVIKRSFWAVIATVMVAGLMYNLVTISQQYFSSPIDVTMQLLHQSELVFPAITLCNMSPVRKSALEANFALGGLSSGSEEKGARRKRRSIGVWGSYTL